MQKRRFPWGQVAVISFFLVLGLLCGLLLGPRLVLPQGDMVAFSLELLWLLLAMYLAIFLQTLLHEAGHLIFGLLTGYRFGSFRIGGFILIMDEERLRFRRLNIAGTGGQCLMRPPEMVDGKLPVALYNLGGALMNLISGSVFLLIWFLLPSIPFVSEAMLMSAIIGAVYALVNGIPLKIGVVDNDGSNALAIGSNRAAMRAWWIQLKANEYVSKGIRLKDMPDEWFDLPSDEEMKNSVVATLGVFACNRLMDEHRFEEAAALMERLLSADTAIVDLHRRLLTCDQMYCELIGEFRKDRLKELFSTSQQRFERSMSKHPGILRSRYCRELLWECRGRKAAATLALFDKSALTYPYPREIEGERELIAIAQQVKKGREEPEICAEFETELT